MLKNILLLFFLLSCSKDSQEQNTSTDSNPKPQNGYDIESKGIPKFLSYDYLELNKIAEISTFRSGEGHSYSDQFESCRSMKHYFKPKSNELAPTIKIFSPIKGTISKLDQEWAGTQVQIKSSTYPDFFVIIFHINLNKVLNLGDTIAINQNLGTHIGAQTWSDIAIGVNTTKGWKLVSYFDCLNDSIFEHYKTRGASSRNEFIISNNARDSSLLKCSGETFLDSRGVLANWFMLN